MSQTGATAGTGTSDPLAAAQGVLSADNIYYAVGSGISASIIEEAIGKEEGGRHAFYSGLLMGSATLTTDFLQKVIKDYPLSNKAKIGPAGRVFSDSLIFVGYESLYDRKERTYSHMFRSFLVAMGASLLTGSVLASVASAEGLLGIDTKPTRSAQRQAERIISQGMSSDDL